MVTQNKKEGNLPVRIEWIDAHIDMPALLELENTGAAPWTQDDFLQELMSKNVCGFAAWRGRVLTGFYLYYLSKQSVLVLNMKTSDEVTLRALLDKLKAKLGKGLRSTILISVRESDLRLQLALRTEGFKATKVLKEQFIDTGEDGYLFEFKADADVLQIVMDKEFVANLD